jgi:putative transposase
MQLRQAFKYRLDPRPSEHEALQQRAAAYRYFYNAALEQRWDIYRRRRSRALPVRLSSPELVFELRRRRAERAEAVADNQWLTCLPAMSLDQAYDDVERAFENWHSGRGHRPRFHAAKLYNSFHFVHHGSFSLVREEGRSYLRLNSVRGAAPLVVRVREHRPCLGTLKTCTVQRQGRHWFVSFSTQRDEPQPATPTGPAIGIDLGVTNALALSDGRLLDIAGESPLDDAFIVRLQRQAARQKRFSNRWRRTQDRIRARKSRIAGRRRHSQHIITTTLAKEHSLIKAEALAVRNMTRSARGTADQPGTNVAAKSGLNRAILDRGFGTIRQMLTYKTSWYGSRLELVDPRNTSRACNRCGSVDDHNRKDEAFRCVACGHTDHADLNAARNILAAPSKPPRQVSKVRITALRKPRQPTAPPALPRPENPPALAPA